MSVIYVVTYDYAQYLEFCRRKRSAPQGDRFRYVKEVRTLALLRQPVDIVFVHGWQGRKDWRAIYNRALIIGKRPG